jgi:hypothetical protein
LQEWYDSKAAEDANRNDPERWEKGFQERREREEQQQKKDGNATVILIGGADLFSGTADISEETKAVSEGVGRSKVGHLKMLNYNYFAEKVTKSMYKELAKEIKKTHPKGEKLIIYGYSRGAEEALKLTRELKKMNINVDLLITIDAANGPFSNKVNRTVEDNVFMSINYYQTEASSIGSRGGANIAAPGNTRTLNNNFNQTGNVFFRNGSNTPVNIVHSTIDEANVTNAINWINYMLRSQ